MSSPRHDALCERAPRCGTGSEAGRRMVVKVEGRREGGGGGGRVNLGRRLENGVLKVGYLELGVYHKVVFECLFKASSNIQYVIFQTIADTILYDL